ncbi:AraC-like DNA-binding protein [Dysgonomonas hofstadii]|uniref:AraC-like DNA-binding protein n=1 Tax=Dysgonomonas hofstadii TaxID=637886 RepID=A0A840CFA9_9BACT|nr:helix-turn-helix domain-containing protein [Dysgonomonas hofstadii]MBB4034687.1 AraC-like DNA-binding protein [Dysgonomonas hofstadii]
MDSFDFILPSPILAPFVKHYWALRIDTPYVSERVTPIGCVQLVFHRKDKMYSHTGKEEQPLAFIGGQCNEFADIQSTGKVDMLVVLFQPHGAKAFFNMPINEFNNRNISIDSLNDRPLVQLADQIQNTSDNKIAIAQIENFLVSRLRNFDNYNYKRMTEVLKSINNTHQAGIKQLANKACLSHKQFSRIFTEYIGTTPKEFTRIIRFQRALYTLQNNPATDQAGLAFDCGFYDQPHLIKEFKTFSGYTPNEYMTICAPYSDYFTQV